MYFIKQYIFQSIYDKNFEEISIFSNGGHLGWRAWLSDITFKGKPLRMIQAKFGLNWPVVSEEKIF
jgi:hypothetical protein